jgi:hypothetical protein
MTLNPARSNNDAMSILGSVHLSYVGEANKMKDLPSLDSNN